MAESEIDMRIFVVDRYGFEKITNSGSGASDREYSGANSG